MESKKKIKSSQNSKRILGIQILRMILSFWIVIIHCCTCTNSFIRKILYTNFHVPAFLIISFYFLYYHLINRNINKIKQRFERLLIPYFIYPIAIFINNNIIFTIFKKKFVNLNQNISIKHLINQLIFGINIHDILWFHFYLIMLTLIYTIISFIFKQDFLFILNILSFICYRLQYLGIIYQFFKRYKEKPHYCMGAIIEIIPYSVTGLSLCSLDLISKFKKNKVKIVALNIIGLYLIGSCNIFITPNGFRYPGINPNLGGICLFIIFLVLPLEKIKNQIITSFLNFITKYTGGIYLLHMILKNNLDNRILMIKKKTIKGGFLIYFLSFFICHIGTLICGKTKLINLFN